MIDSKLRRQLEAIDWDFPASHPGTSSLSHWYPGTFPAQLPATLVQAFTDYDDLIFDPYGGAGTTSSESIRLGRRVWITDINPIGILSSYTYSSLLILQIVKPEKLSLLFEYTRTLINTTPTYQGFDFEGVLENISNIDDILGKHMRPVPSEFFNQIRENRNPNFESLKKWLHPDTLDELKEFYLGIINLQKPSFLRILLESMISSNIRALCSQNKSWGHIADNVYPKEFIYKDIRQQFLKWLSKTEKSISKCSLEGARKLKGIRYWASIHNWNDVKSVKYKPREKAKLLVTSPPYADAIDYLYAQKLSMYFFGLSDEDISLQCLQEIGARRKRFKSHSRDDWAEQMAAAATKHVKYLKGLFITILPHKNHGREAGLNRMIEELKSNGWREDFRVDRSIDQKKTRQSWTSIKQETISIFSQK